MGRCSRLAFLALGSLVTLACSSSSSDTPPAGSSPDGSSPDGPKAGEDGGPIEPGDDSGGPGGVVNTTTETFEHGGVTRRYVLSVPVSYDAAKKYPVYMFMHGNPGSAEGMLGAFPVHPATKGEAIVVYPNATTEHWDHTLTDNSDVTYLKALIDQVDAKVSIDKQRILLSGWSGGGFMSSQMACRYASLVRAIGVHAGGAPYDPNNGDPNYVPPCDGAAIATIVTHGTVDGSVHVSSGTWAGDHWAMKNGCGNTKTDATPAPCQTYDGCPADKPVKVCIVEGQGHPLWNQAHAVAWEWFKSLP